MPKKFRNYVIKGQEHVDRKTGKTIPSPSVWRSVKDTLPEIAHVKYFADNKYRMSLTDKVIESMLLLANTVESQLEEVK